MLFAVVRCLLFVACCLLFGALLLLIAYDWCCLLCVGMNCFLCVADRCSLSVVCCMLVMIVVW